MATRDPRIDAYIARAAPFAQPILRHLRAIVHEACPDVEETLKWSMPHFMHQGILCRMAAFKAHCALGFWKGSLIVGRAGVPALGAMGEFGRITSIEDLPPARVLGGYVKQAVRLNERQVAKPVQKRPPTRVVVPPELRTALAGNPAAGQVFRNFTPSQRREYTEWIAEPKGAETRARRAATAVEWIAEGKQRNWKYQR